MSLNPVLVLGGRERHALAIVRSLGKAGIPVYTADDHSFCTSSLSKYCKGQFVYPSPEKNPEGFILFLKDLLSKQKFEMVFAVTDILPIFLSKHKEELSKLTKVLVPHWDIFERANNKKITFELAKSLRIPMPKTFPIRTMQDLETFLPELQFPVVLKPASKTNIQATSGGFSIKATYANSAEELREKFSANAKADVDFLIQEFIPGEGGYGVGLLCEKGVPRVSFAFKRLHEYPISGGASTLRTGIHHPEMVKIAEKLLAGMSWDGVAMAEFKIDSRDNTPKLIEVNGRFWGSLALAVYSGVDFPYLLYRQTRQELLPPVQVQTGCKARWLVPGDIMYFLEAIRLKGNFFATCRDFFQFCGVRDDVLSLSDPLPILGEIKVSLGYFFEVLLGKRSIHGELRKK